MFRDAVACNTAAHCMVQSKCIENRVVGIFGGGGGGGGGEVDGWGNTQGVGNRQRRMRVGLPYCNTQDLINFA